MLIGIISDTHDNPKSLLKAVGLFNNKKIDLMIHCGDWVSVNMPNFCKGLNAKIISVFGNNEGDKFLFLDKWRDKIEFYDSVAELELDGRKIAVYHGQHQELLDGLVHSQKYDAVFSGHTHVALNKKIKKTLHVNPGSTSGMAWDNIVETASVAIYNTESNEAEILSI